MRNKYLKGLFAVVLAVSLLFSLSVCFVSFAAERKGYIYNVGNTTLRVRTGPGTNYAQLTHNGENVSLRDGDTVVILETVPCANNDSANPYWSKINFTFSGATLTGYVSSIYVMEIDDSDVVIPDTVPAEYESYIKSLLAAHPNWKFVIYNTGINWSDLFAEDAEGYLGRSLIPNSYPWSYRSTQTGAFDFRNDKWIPQDSGTWYQANSQTIAYYMDPRNFLNEKNVFMFEGLSYDSSTQTLDGVKKMLKKYPAMDGVKIKDKDSKDILYADAFIDAAKYSDVSPYHLASRAILETAGGTSGSVTGNYPGYEGYYNFYNIGAYQGSNPIANGLNFAKNGGSLSQEKKTEYMIPWNSQFKSIVGGAKWIGASYINIGQNTLYFQKFNTSNKVYYHQYMGNLAAPASESSTIRGTYSDLGILDQSFTFIVPYYKNMPASACQLPASNNYSPNNWLKTLTVDGYSIGFDASKTIYSLTVPAGVSSLNVSAAAVNSKAKISGTGTISLKDGSNTISVVVTAENGSKRTYTINVTKSSQKIPLKGISLSATSLSMYKGDSQTLNVTYNPSNTTDSKTVTWTTSDKSVATVSNGKVTAVGKGTATITAQVGSFTATCKVTVTTDIRLGDVDADGEVTLADALRIYKHITGEMTLSGTAQSAADTDKDNKVTVADALRIYKFKSGEIKSL
ncbi:MAG: Ig-like domain-containing protein [Oscillospiraceae bacterium]|nr:Ig-like domain-containing protein [Oscillospiraceae bacterium]